MFRTALPFGYVAQLVVLLAVLALTVTAVRRWRRERTRGRAVAAFASGGVLVTWLALASAQPAIDEWNPHAFCPADAVGVWQDGRARLVLRADGTYAVDPGPEYSDFGRRPSQGRWLATGHAVHLYDEHSGMAPLLDVVVVKGEYRLIRHVLDPDVWDGAYGFARAPRARAPVCRTLCS